MNIITATQLIFSRVESEYSPTNRSGFQTVYKDPKLPDPLVKEIEQRIQCFSPIDGRRRLQYFIVSQVVVVSKTIPIAAHKTIVDRSGREGIFIVHCMIISLQEFSRVGNNPFALLDSYEPYHDAETMVRSLGQATGVLEKTTIQPVTVPGTDLLSVNEMLKLIGTVPHSSQSSKGAIVFFGLVQEVESVLRTLHGLLTPRQRLNCTFDTCLDRCNIPAHITYGLVAYSQRPGGFYMATVDIERRQVTVSAGSGKKDLYTGWLEEAANTRSLSAITVDAEDGYLLASAFEARHPLPRFDIKAEVASEFFATYQQIIIPRLEKSIAAWLPVEVARAVCSSVIAAFTHDSGEMINRALSGAACEKAPADYLSAWTLDWLTQEKSDLPGSAHKHMLELARQGRFPTLLFYVATTGKKIDTKARDEALGAMNNDQFEQVLNFFLNPISPVHYIHATHMNSLFNEPNFEAMNHVQASDFIHHMIDEELSAHLDKVSSLVRLLKREELASIEKAINKKKRIPPSFLEAVQKQRQKLGNDPTLIERLKFW